MADLGFQLWGRALDLRVLVFNNSVLRVWGIVLAEQALGT